MPLGLGEVELEQLAQDVAEEVGEAGNYSSPVYLRHKRDAQDDFDPPFDPPDGKPVIDAAKAYLTSVMAQDTSNPRLLRHAEQFMKIMRVLVRTLAPPSSKSSLAEIAAARNQSPNLVETFNSRLIREFAPVAVGLVGVQQQQAVTAVADAKLRAVEAELDAKREGREDLAAAAAAVREELGEVHLGHEGHEHAAPVAPEAPAAPTPPEA